MLCGRDQERARLRSVVAGLREGRSFASLVRGPAGIGKSTLIDDLLDASGDGLEVLRTHGHQTEVDIPYAGLAELVAPVLHLRDDLPERQRRALGAALALEPPAPGDRFAVPAALLGLLGQAAEARPVLAVVDDAHWLDAGSLDAVLFAAQRVASEGIGVLLAARDRDGAAVATSGLEVIELGPLDRASALEILEHGGSLAPDVAEVVVAAAAGNPLALRELPRGLSTDQREGRNPLIGPLPGEGAAGASITRQLEAQPPSTRRALCLVAAASGSSRRVIDAALSRMGLDADDLRPAAAAGLVDVVDGRVELSHPLVGARAYHGEPSATRRAAHAALGAVVEDPLRRAWHVAGAAVGTDAAAADGLEDVAGTTRGRGAHRDAAQAFLRAAELSPDADARMRRTLEAARECSVAGDHARAAELAAVVAADASGEVLVAAQQLRAHVLLRGGEPVEAQRLLEASIAHMQSGDMDALLATALRARALAESIDDGLVTVAGLLAGEALMALGRSAEGERLLAEAEPLLLEGDPLSELAELLVMGAMCSVWGERFTRAERALDRFVAVCREAGAASRLPYTLTVRAQLRWRRGRWAGAYADADEAVRLARDTAQAGVLAVALPALARCEAAIGHVTEARRYGEEAAALAEAAGSKATLLHALGALGFTELGVGRPEAALLWLERAATIDRRLGHGEPAIALFAADHVEALVRVGRTEEAEQALDRLRARAAATGGAWAHAVAQRCAVLLAGEEDVEHAAAAATAWHDRVDMPFERARTELVLGERLRRARRRADARPPLERALRCFDQLGAHTWADRARAELRATGAAQTERSPAPVERLTPRELQVALLVAQGLTNREVGASLFLSAKTVEHHLGATFRKLDLRSRVQLAGLLAREVDAPA